MNGDDTKSLCGWVKLFSPRGVQVTLPVGIGFNYAAAMGDIDAALAAGWLPREIGLEAGEQVEEFMYVSRIEVDGKNGACSRVFLYVDNDAMVFKSLDKYLNTDQDIADFETATGLKLDAVPLFAGEAAPKREGRTAQYCIKAPKAFRAVWKANPKFKEAPKGEDNRTFAEKRKRDFVRWDGQQPASAPTTHPEDRLTSAQINELEGLIVELDNLRGFKMDMPRFYAYLNECHKSAIGHADEITQDHYRTAKGQLDRMVGEAKKKAGAS